MIKFYKIHLK